MLSLSKRARVSWHVGGLKPEQGLEDFMPAYPTTGYMNAELCLNGHLITGDIENEPEKTSKFCRECGAATVRACPECGASIRGDHIYEGTIAWMTVPSYCHSCGAAYPWTIAKIAAAKEHAAEIEGLDEAERKQLQEDNR